MINPVWDFDITLSEFKRVLKNPKERRFPLFFARVLSRVPFYEAFHRLITPRQFKRHYPKVRRLVDADLLGAGRVHFWDWLYRRLSKPV